MYMINPLDGLVVCPYCGSKVKAFRNRNGEVMLKCRTKAQCWFRPIPVNDVFHRVLAELKDYLQDMEIPMKRPYNPQKVFEPYRLHQVFDMMRDGELTAEQNNRILKAVINKIELTIDENASRNLSNPPVYDLTITTRF